ncbi:MAG: NADH-quinone oxidoreductase subunit NuoE [bacterium]
MAIEFTPDNKKKLEETLTRYPTKRAALLPTLWIAQQQFGWISQEVMEYVGKLLDLPPIKVYEVVTFYTMFQQKPVGKYHFQVCRTLSCELCGKGEILNHLKKKLNIGVGETTPDGRFSLVEVECLGSCGTAPMLQLNDDFHENLTVERIDEILKGLS